MNLQFKWRSQNNRLILFLRFKNPLRWMGYCKSKDKIYARKSGNKTKSLRIFQYNENNRRSGQHENCTLRKGKSTQLSCPLIMSKSHCLYLIIHLHGDSQRMSRNSTTLEMLFSLQSPPPDTVCTTLAMLMCVKWCYLSVKLWFQSYWLAERPEGWLSQ